MLSPQLTGVEDNATLPYASRLCGACFDACPVRIDIPSILVDLRRRHVEEAAEASRVPPTEQVVMAAAAWTMGDPGRWRLAGRAGRLGRLLSPAPRSDQLAAAAAVGLDGEPRPAGAADRDVPRLVVAHRGPSEPGGDR